MKYNAEHITMALSSRIRMDRDRNVAELKKLLALVESEKSEQRFRRMGIDWIPGGLGFDHAIRTAQAAHLRHGESHLSIHPEICTYLELRHGEELGKPDTVRISVSQPYPYDSFECYLPLDWFMEEWLKIGGEL